MARLQSDDIAHTATTDHSIPRRARPLKADHKPGLRPPALLDRPLRPFHKEGRSEEDADRDFALALVKAIRQHKAIPPLYLPRALRLLEQAAKKYPKDVPLLNGLATAQDLVGEKEKALKTFEAILRLAPRHVRALRMAALLTGQLKKSDASLGYWKKLAGETPLDPEAQFYLALLLSQVRKHEQALAACEKLLAVDPMRAEGHWMRAHCLDKLGKKAEAEAARKKAEALATSTFEPFRRQFAQLVED